MRFFACLLSACLLVDPNWAQIHSWSVVEPNAHSTFYTEQALALHTVSIPERYDALRSLWRFLLRFQRREALVQTLGLTFPGIRMRISERKPPAFYFFSSRDQIITALALHGVRLRRAWMLPTLYLRFLQALVDNLAEKNDVHGITYTSGPLSLGAYLLLGVGGHAIPTKKSISVAPIPYLPAFSYVAAHESGHVVMNSREELLEGSWISFSQLSWRKKMVWISVLGGSLISAVTVTWFILGGITRNAWFLTGGTFLAVLLGLLCSYVTGGLVRHIVSQGQVLDLQPPWSLITFYSLVSRDEEAAELVASGLLHHGLLGQVAMNNVAFFKKLANLKKHVLANENENLSLWMHPFRIFIFSSRTMIVGSIFLASIYGLVGPDSVLWPWLGRFALLFMGRIIESFISGPRIWARFAGVYERLPPWLATGLKHAIALPLTLLWEVQRLSIVIVAIIVSCLVFAPLDIPHQWQNPVTIVAQVASDIEIIASNPNGEERIRGSSHQSGGFVNNHLNHGRSFLSTVKETLRRHLKTFKVPLMPPSPMLRKALPEALPPGMKVSRITLFTPRDLHHLKPLPPGLPDEVYSNAGWENPYEFIRHNVLGNVSDRYDLRPEEDWSQLPHPITYYDSGFTGGYITLPRYNPNAMDKSRDVAGIVLNIMSPRNGSLVAHWLFMGSDERSAVINVQAGGGEYPLDLGSYDGSEALHFKLDLGGSGSAFSRQPPIPLKIRNVRILLKGKDAIRVRRLKYISTPDKPGYELYQFASTPDLHSLRELIIHLRPEAAAYITCRLNLASSGESSVFLGNHVRSPNHRTIEINVPGLKSIGPNGTNYLEVSYPPSSKNASIESVDAVYAPPQGFATLEFLGMISGGAALFEVLKNVVHHMPPLSAYGIAGIFAAVLTLTGILYSSKRFKPRSLLVSG